MAFRTYANAAKSIKGKKGSYIISQNYKTKMWTAKKD